MSDRDAQIRGNLNAMRRSHGLPESAGPSLPAQQWWVDDLAERQTELEDAKRSLRRSAMAIESIGCDRRCHPERTRWFRRQAEHHDQRCEDRRRVVHAIRTYTDLLADQRFSRQAKRAVDTELARYNGAVRKAGK
jgi:hypothetical protein